MKSYLVSFPDDFSTTHGFLAKDLVIHGDDWRFATLVAQSGNDQAKGLEHYLTIGGVAAAALARIVSEHNGVPLQDGQVRAGMTILDLAAQYGHVTRRLDKYFPDAKIVAGELYENAAYFDRLDLGIESAFLGTDPSEMGVFFRFDVVLAHNLLTNVHPEDFPAWLARVVSFAKKDGLIVFNTQGLVALNRRFARKTMNMGRFYFASASGERGRAFPAGETVVAPSTVLRMAEGSSVVHVVEYREAALLGIQDIFVLRRL